MEDNKNVDTIQDDNDIENACNQKMSTAVQGVVTAAYQGPLPPPNIMRGYDDVCPGAAKMILDEFQVNSAHVREMERKSREAEIRIIKNGQWMAFGFGCALFAIVIWSFIIGWAWVAGASIITALVTVVTAFLKR